MIRQKSNNTILVYTHEYLPFGGGVATFSYEYARHLSALGKKIVVLAPQYDNGTSAFDTKQSFITYRMKLLPNRASYLNHIISFIYFLFLFIKFKPGVVYLTDFFAQRTIAIFNFFNLASFVSAIHGTDILTNFDHPIKRILFEKIYSRSSVLVCVSQYTKNVLCAKGIRNLCPNIRVIYNGIDVEIYSKTLNDKIVQDIRKEWRLDGKKILLSLCRLSRRKGIDDVIRSFPIILKKENDIVLLICGEGDYGHELMNLVDKLSLKESVRFVGFVSEEDKIHYLDIADIYIMLSRQDKNDFEGFGISFLEAAMRKIPIIGSNHGGIPEAILDGKTGILIKDLSPESIANNILNLLRDNNLRESLIENGYQRCFKELNWKNLIAANLDIFMSGTSFQNDGIL